MKKFILAALVGFLMVAPSCWAYEACVGVTASAGGTDVVPQGNATIEWITLAGSSALYCRFNSTGGGGGAPTSTAFDIYLSGLGATWNAPTSTLLDKPGVINRSRVMPDKITCLSSSGTQQVCYVKY